MNDNRFSLMLTTASHRIIHLADRRRHTFHFQRPTSNIRRSTFTNMFLSSALRRSFAATSSKRFFHASPLCLEKLNVKGLAERANLKGQNVLVRVDLNVPLAKVRRYYVLATPSVHPCRLSHFFFHLRLVWMLLSRSFVVVISL